MAADLQFSRNTKVFLEFGGTYWELPVLDGFSFSQATNSTEVTLSEMENSSGVSRRGRQLFNDSFAPAEWSFDTYARPNNGSAVEEALWAFLAGKPTSFGGGNWNGGTITKSGAATTIDFESSNSSTLGTFNLYFVMGACGNGPSFSSGGANQITIYKLTDAVVNSCSMDFEIDGIATISWSGFAQIISEMPTLDVTGNLVNTGVSSTDNFIRNRLTTLTLTHKEGVTGVNADVQFDLTLTGGSITIENNISYLIPETLCTVNTPIGHVTGARSISGNFTCYLNGSTTNGSEDLFSKLIGSTDTVRNKFDMAFSIGGSDAPKVQFNIPQGHLEIPAHSIEDVISLDTTFHALPSTAGAADELTVVYTGATGGALAPTATVVIDDTEITTADITAGEVNKSITISSTNTTNADNSLAVVKLVSGDGTVTETYYGQVAATSWSVTAPAEDLTDLVNATDENDTIDVYVTISTPNGTYSNVDSVGTITKNLDTP